MYSCMSEKTRTTVSPNHATFHNTVTDFISKSMSRWVGEKWRNYKFRFVPWIMLNLKKEIKVMHRTDTPFKPNDTYIAELWHLLGEFQRPDLNCIFKPSLRRSMFLDLHNENNQILLRLKGFSLVVKPSQSHGAGFGVFVSSGRIRAGEMIALYPGTIYEPFHPILIQSVRNPYILRCSDGKCVDGKSTGLSKVMYKSIHGRDRFGSAPVCDISWIDHSHRPVNPLSMGQIVNNADQEHESNVTYHELSLDITKHPKLALLLPNNQFESVRSDNSLKLVPLIATRDIDVDEELRSAYFSCVYSQS